MSIPVYFYRFSKRRNSTAVPSGGTVIPCNIKEPCSVLNPVLELATGADVINYDMFAIPDFNRYYFITDVSFDLGVWRVSGTVDPLASHKLDILGKTEYVLRSASASDGSVVDRLYPITRTVQEGNLEIGNWCTDTSQLGGIYVVGIGGYSDRYTGIGGAFYFMMNLEKLREFFAYIFSDGIIDEIDDISNALSRTLFNPYQYLISCQWLPLDQNSIGGVTLMPVRLGYWNTGINADKLYQGSRVERDISVSLPVHPQRARGVYMDLPPYTEYTLYMPGFGAVPLPGDQIVNASLSIKVVVDLVTGDAQLFVSSGGAYIAYAASHVGVNIPLSSDAANLSGFAGSISGGVGAVLSGLATGGAAGAAVAVSGAAAGIASAAESVMPQARVQGTAGTFAEYIGRTPYISYCFRLAASDDNQHNGRPLMANRSLSGLSGFTQLAHGDLNLSCYDEERAAIADYVTGGFFIE